LSKVPFRTQVLNDIEIAALVIQLIHISACALLWDLRFRNVIEEDAVVAGGYIILCLHGLGAAIFACAAIWTWFLEFSTPLLNFMEGAMKRKGAQEEEESDSHDLGDDTESEHSDDHHDDIRDDRRSRGASWSRSHSRSRSRSFDSGQGGAEEHYVHGGESEHYAVAVHDDDGGVSGASAFEHDEAETGAGATTFAAEDTTFRPGAFFKKRRRRSSGASQSSFAIAAAAAEFDDSDDDPDPAAAGAPKRRPSFVMRAFRRASLSMGLTDDAMNAARDASREVAEATPPQGPHPNDELARE
jgi:hypothetical protein